tara:strand:+ start:379 stop:876 length:498 start_codon:yes stop_codon:yes gene_type:complete
MFNNWKIEEVLILDQAVKSHLTTEDIEALAKLIGRSYQATRKKILEIINLIPSSRVVNELRSSGQLINTTSDFPEDIDHSYIPPVIFSDVLKMRKAKLKPGDKVLIRTLDHIKHMTEFETDGAFNYADKELTVGLLFGKSFYVIEDDNDYPIRFHLDLVKDIYTI